jgi:hypothetical protein
MSLVLGKNASNELKEINLTNTGFLKVDLAGSSGGAIEANVDITGNSIGLATEATLSALNTKLTVGDDDTLTEALQTVVYGRKDATPSGLRAIKADDLGRLMVDIDADGVGLATEATLSVLNTKITNGEDDQLTGAQQVLMYGRKDTSPTGLYAMKVNNNGALHVLPSFQNLDNNLATLAIGAGGTATSTSINMGNLNYSFLTFFGSSTNATDPIIVEVSADNATWYEASEYFVNTNPVGANVNYSVNIPNVAGQYWRLKQTDTLTTAFTLIVNASRK